MKNRYRVLSNSIMETPPEQKDETDHTLWEFVKMWASLIMLSLESFSEENDKKRKK